MGITPTTSTPLILSSYSSLMIFLSGKESSPSSESSDESLPRTLRYL